MRKLGLFAYPGLRLLRPPKFAVAVHHRFPRRDFLLTSAAGGMTLLGGCRPSSPSTAPTSVRTDVPLRVLICGDPAWGDAIRTAWGGVAQQPLAIEVIAASQSAAESGDGDRPTDSTERRSGGQTPEPASQFARRVIAGLARADVAIVPGGVIADTVEAEAVLPLGDDVLQDEALAADQFFPVIGQSLLRWGGTAFGIPLGCAQPAMLVSSGLAAKLGQDDVPAVPKSWVEYDQVLQQVIAQGGSAAEPLAAGAAAKLFLWRASDAAPPVWLFDRVSFEPVLASPVYVETLRAMGQSFELYKKSQSAVESANLLTPGEVWSSVAGGALSIGVAWPAAAGDPPRVETIGDTLVFPLPRLQTTATADDDDSVASATPVLPDPDAPLGLISSRCRQSVAAKRFLIWLSGGEGSEMIRSVIGPMTMIRRDGGPTDGAAVGGDYNAFLAQRLAAWNVRPTLRLHGYDRYLMALDREVLAYLTGTQQDPAAALASASAAWQAITEEIGPQRQAKAWRLAQGMRN